MGCCESKDDPYNYHFDPPIKSFRESKLTISKENINRQYNVNL